MKKTLNGEFEMKGFGDAERILGIDIMRNHKKE